MAGAYSHTPAGGIGMLAIGASGLEISMAPTGQSFVIVTRNLFGDILSDETAMLSGSIGMLGSAALDANGKGLFEPSGGRPTSLARTWANPLAMILSAAMMLRYTLDRPDQVARIEKAIRTVLHNGVRTGDVWQKGASALAPGKWAMPC